MIFKRSPNHRSTVSLQGLSRASHREISADTDGDLRALRSGDATPPVKGGVFGCNDFVFLSDNVNCWVVRASAISLLEAYGNCTRVYLGHATALIRRPLRECERRLDPSTFFRTRRDCIVNLNWVKQMRVLDAKRFLFVLLDGKEVPMSGKQSLLFRKAKVL